MEQKLFDSLISRRFSSEEARIIVSAITLIVDNTKVESGTQEMQQLIYALGDCQ